jgi:hypothetical protein
MMCNSDEKRRYDFNGLLVHNLLRLLVQNKEDFNMNYHILLIYVHDRTS